MNYFIKDILTSVMLVQMETAVKDYNKLKTQILDTLLDTPYEGRPSFP